MYTMTTNMVPKPLMLKYLVQTMLIGGALGLTHGYTRSNKQNSDIVNDMATGMFLAPWAPIAIPLYMMNTRGGCPMRRVKEHHKME